MSKVTTSSSSSAWIPTSKLYHTLYNADDSYDDAPTEGVRRALEWFTGTSIPRDTPIDTSRVAYIRMGTTVATNALLERKGAKSALLIVGFVRRPR